MTIDIDKLRAAHAATKERTTEAEIAFIVQAINGYAQQGEVK